MEGMRCSAGELEGALRNTGLHVQGQIQARASLAGFLASISMDFNQTNTCVFTYLSTYFAPELYSEYLFIQASMQIRFKDFFVRLSGQWSAYLPT